MAHLSFKTAAYKIYAPWLFKIVKIKAHYLFGFKIRNPSEVYAMLWDRYIAKKYLLEAKRIGGTPTKQFSWNKRSDTIFILGCGSSINQVTSKEWQIIKKHDSIGVNYFYFHEFNPNGHFIELGRSAEANQSIHQLLLNNPKRKAEVVYMQIRHLATNNIKLDCSAKRVNLYSPTTMKSTNPNTLNKYLQHYYYPSSCKAPLIHHSSTLDCVINFAIRQGYKKICLVGVDLNNNAYFWDNKPENLHYSMAIKATNADYQLANWSRENKSHHATVNKEISNKLNCLDLMSYLSLLKKTVFKRHKIEITVTNPNSMLTSLFPYKSISDLTK